MKRSLPYLFARMAYILSILLVIWLYFFLLGKGLGSTIDSPAQSDLASSMRIDIGLLVLFGLQHSVMARSTVKRWVSKIVPEHVERSIYVFQTFLVLSILLLFWKPIPLEIWNIENPIFRYLVYAVNLGGWMMTFWTPRLTDYRELFGLKKPYLYMKGRPYVAPEFREVSIYRFVRHPMMLAFLIAFWAAPTMTAGHLLFAAGMTLYILIGVYFEEKSLKQEFGDVYVDYCRRVPMLLPVRIRLPLKNKG